MKHDELAVSTLGSGAQCFQQSRIVQVIAWTITGANKELDILAQF